MPGPEGAATFKISADVYERHVGRYGAPLAASLISRARVKAGLRVLDVGCGPGALTSALVDVCGAGNVAAVDPSRPFVDACADRCPGADVREAAAERLPFEEESFDVVLSQLVVNFLADPERGVLEMVRVARPGGVVGAAVWDYAGEMTLLRAFWDAATAVDPDRAPALDEGRIMRFCQPAELAGLWRAAGLADVETGSLEAFAEYEHFDSLWEPFAQGVAPSGAYATSLDRETQTRLRDEFRRRLGTPDGSFTLTARAWCVTGVRD
jgi:SAM-dependent methyltransferase